MRDPSSKEEYERFMHKNCKIMNNDENKNEKICDV
jgi:hypothetical protein